MMEKRAVKHFTDLIAWQKTREIKQKIYKIIQSFPEEEKYNITSQMRRAACSVTANIAEGYGRYHYKENIQFCRLARGSIYELQDHLITSFDQNYIKADIFNELDNDILEAIRLIDGYIRFLKLEKPGYGA